MILQALADYYHRIPNAAPPGFSVEKISFCLVLDRDGKLLNIEDLRVSEGKKTRPASMVVPYRGKRSGTGVLPNFLWDNTGYVLGIDGKGKPERTAAAFESFRQFINTVCGECDDEGVRAVQEFLRHWNPASPDPRVQVTDGLIDANVVFRLNGKLQYVHESHACREAWSRFFESETAGDAPVGLCLVTGKEAPIAQLHPAIKGVTGAQTTGAALVSFNLDSFTSYDKRQNLNAPVSTSASFRYTTALNSILADSSRRAHLGDATVVWWTEKPNEMEDIFGNLLGSSSLTEDSQLRDRIGRFVNSLVAGKPDAEFQATTPFYILGLSPNASRLSVRLWLVSNVQELSGRLREHFTDLAICGARTSDPPLSIYRILRETAREAKDIPPLLAGSVLRAILSGGPYPDALFAAIIRRVRADGNLTYQRAAVIKAWINRKIRYFNTGEELPMSLDTTRADPAYLLGRLFATLEKIQEDASNGSLNRTIKDSYFTSAAATPAAIFPRLLKLSHHHQRKLSTGLQIARNRLIQEIMSTMQEFPTMLSLEQQGIFYIGYYHQRQDFFTSKNQNEATVSAK